MEGRKKIYLIYSLAAETAPGFLSVTRELRNKRKRGKKISFLLFSFSPADSLSRHFPKNFHGENITGKEKKFKSDFISFDSN